MLEKNIATAAALLRSLSSPRTGVAQMAKDLRVSPSNLIGMLAELSEQGLVDMSSLRTRRAGRPKRLVRATSLGMEYIDAYELLETKTLKSRRSDLRKAVSDADYAARLTARGVLPYELFLELNALAERS